MHAYMHVAAMSVTVQTISAAGDGLAGAGAATANPEGGAIVIPKSPVRSDTQVAHGHSVGAPAFTEPRPMTRYSLAVTGIMGRQNNTPEHDEQKTYIHACSMQDVVAEGAQNSMHRLHWRDSPGCSDLVVRWVLVDTLRVDSITC